jgi:hypothetical protein
MSSRDVITALDATAVQRCFDLNVYLAHIDVTYERLGLPDHIANAKPAPRSAAPKESNQRTGGTS